MIYLFSIPDNARNFAQVAVGFAGFVALASLLVAGSEGNTAAIRAYARRVVFVASAMSGLCWLILLLVPGRGDIAQAAALVRAFR